MKRNGSSFEMLAAKERMKLAAFARGPSAVRGPRLTKRGSLWCVTLGRNGIGKISGIGPTVELALRAFDRNYLAALEPPLPHERSVWDNI
jgi:hypothetical protein